MIPYKYIFLCSLLGLFSIGEAQDKIDLEDLKVLTLHAGDYTTGRRSSPVPQLKCVGGSAKNAFSPRSVQCTNVGFDGFDYQWKCTADLPHEYEFGKVTVTCEGYDYPEDPYVLRGSCGLEYYLENSADSGKKSHSAYGADKKQGLENSADSGKKSHSAYGADKKQGASWNVESIVTFIVILFIIYIAYTMCSGGNDHPAPSAPRPPGRPGGFDGGPGYPGSGPGFGPPPPSYDETFGRKTHSSAGGAANADGPGFWTGATLGALGGYFAGSRGANNQRGSSGMGSTGSSWFARDTGFDSSRADQPSTSGMRESTGYGGTRRR